MQKELTIQLPESTEALKNVLNFLRKYNLITNEKAHSIETEAHLPPTPPQGRWALAAERLKSESYLKGHGEEVENLIADFRDGFDL
ncbi:MAG: hypothetical protein GY757_42150 [bacterium]|nr:hypothetical protein [bacterium]